jgi:pimeloyl-ACP methyl ester carboxylesterase
MSETRTGTLPVPGASIYYEAAGSGPVLLIIQGGDGGAGRTAGLVTHLTDAYTVVTYDRRGLARSVPSDPAAPIPITTHADDAYRLLSAVTDGPPQHPSGITDGPAQHPSGITHGPAYVFGSSFGALIGLTLAAAHPGSVRTLVAHDPATLGLLPPHERARAEHDLADLVEIHRREGVLPALKRLGELVAADFTDTEPGVAPPTPPGPGRIADLGHFFAHDIAQMRAAALDATDIAALKASTTRVIPAVGRASRSIWNHDCAVALSTLLATDLIEFPGGHSLSTHPTAFATRLRTTLTAS